MKTVKNILGVIAVIAMLPVYSAIHLQFLAKQQIRTHRPDERRISGGLWQNVTIELLVFAGGVLAAGFICSEILAVIRTAIKWP